MRQPKPHIPMAAPNQVGVLNFAFDVVTDRPELTPDRQLLAIRQTLLPELDRLLEKAALQSRDIHIDQLTLDLGAFEVPVDWDTVSARFSQELTSALAPYLRPFDQVSPVAHYRPFNAGLQPTPQDLSDRIPAIEPSQDKVPDHIATTAVPDVATVLRHLRAIVQAQGPQHRAAAIAALLPLLANRAIGSMAKRSGLGPRPRDRDDLGAWYKQLARKIDRAERDVLLTLAKALPLGTRQQIADAKQIRTWPRNMGGQTAWVHELASKLGSPSGNDDAPQDHANKAATLKPLFDDIGQLAGIGTITVARIAAILRELARSGTPQRTDAPQPTAADLRALMRTDKAQAEAALDMMPAPLVLDLITALLGQSDGPLHDALARLRTVTSPDAAYRHIARALLLGETIDIDAARKAGASAASPDRTLKTNQLARTLQQLVSATTQSARREATARADQVRKSAPGKLRQTAPDTQGPGDPALDRVSSDGETSEQSNPGDAAATAVDSGTSASAPTTQPGDFSDRAQSESLDRLASGQFSDPSRPHDATQSLDAPSPDGPEQGARGHVTENDTSSKAPKAAETPRAKRATPDPDHAKFSDHVAENEATDASADPTSEPAQTGGSPDDVTSAAGARPTPDGADAARASHAPQTPETFAQRADTQAAPTPEAIADSQSRTDPESATAPLQPVAGTDRKSDNESQPKETGRGQDDVARHNGDDAAARSNPAPTDQSGSDAWGADTILGPDGLPAPAVSLGEGAIAEGPDFTQTKLRGPALSRQSGTSPQHTPSRSGPNPASTNPASTDSALGAIADALDADHDRAQAPTDQDHNQETGAAGNLDGQTGQDAPATSKSPLHTSQDEAGHTHSQPDDTNGKDAGHTAAEGSQTPSASAGDRTPQKVAQDDLNAQTLDDHVLENAAQQKQLADILDASLPDIGPHARQGFELLWALLRSDKPAQSEADFWITAFGVALDQAAPKFEDTIHQFVRALTSAEPDPFILRGMIARLGYGTEQDAALRHRTRAALEQLLQDPAQEAPQAAEVTPKPASRHPTDCAGLVLFHPFITLLFDRLEIEKDKRGILPEHLGRAAGVLGGLVRAEAPVDHPLDPLERCLLGHTADTPLPERAPLMASDLQLIDSLVLSVIERWGRLGSTSPGGLRETFVARSGLIDDSDAQSDVLTVSKGPFDMLLDGLPWSISPVALPWMPKPLIVKWRGHDD
ncbi:contractile injection system tape measure protein [Yoonia sediminilitoris]|uniref:Uncharacterized protein n=1 Tax=Yoonia sediminilitoris TaxID=1286148 RepID=A0A2T6KME5_9RHOB|nr:contractile injection system tape measure protein [Yoonia sediminilitoris]PUB17389.1 hypothetical protein C8N45_102401 [Yoonia sediminilitoris]RCW97684.1 hypothetical protein DFP92_102401 [Yoonia sediminilitoris]